MEGQIYHCMEIYQYICRYINIWRYMEARINGDKWKGSQWQAVAPCRILKASILYKYIYLYIYIYIHDYQWQAVVPCRLLKASNKHSSLSYSALHTQPSSCNVLLMA
jgi:hypothetical protein